MGSGKHASDEEFDFEIVKKILLSVIILALIALVVFGVYTGVKKLKESRIEQTSASDNNITKSSYEVLGKIKIDKINIEQPILDSVEEDALENGVIKLYGDKLNSSGNFCIAGHNYENIFKRLDEMEIGDEFEILDDTDNISKYKITEIYSVEPTDLTALRSEEGKTQITLITCENYSTKRLVIKSEIVE